MTKAQMQKVIEDFKLKNVKLNENYELLFNDNKKLMEENKALVSELAFEKKVVVQSYNVNDVKYMEGLEAKNYELGQQLQDAQNRLHEFTQGSLMKEVKRLEKYIIKKCLDELK